MFCCRDFTRDPFTHRSPNQGVLRFSLTAPGKSAHSAYPWNGSNAIQTLLEGIQSIQAATHEGKRVFDNAGPQWHTTMSVNIISGGAVINQVPAKAEARVDVRFTEEWTADSLKKVIQAHAAGCQVEFFFEQPMLLSPPESDFMVTARQLIEKYTGAAVEFSRGHGTSDPHWTNFKTVMTKPIGGGLHQDDEWLDFPSLVTFYSLMADFVSVWGARA
eukprot:Colp12_sorted_trinity150504_noHs@20487